MKYFCISIFCLAGSLACLTAHAQSDVSINDFALTMNGNVVQEAISKVFETDADVKEIITRGQACAVKYSGQNKSHSPSVLELMGGRIATPNDNPAPTIELADKEGGQLIVNNTANYQSAMVSYVAKSKMIIEAREKRFRITLSDLGYAAAAKNTGYWPIKTLFASGWKNAIAALTAPANQVANCIVQENLKKDEW